MYYYGKRPGHALELCTLRNARSLIFIRNSYSAPVTIFWLKTLGHRLFSEESLVPFRPLVHFNLLKWGLPWPTAGSKSGVCVLGLLRGDSKTYWGSSTCSPRIKLLWSSLSKNISSCVCFYCGKSTHREIYTVTHVQVPSMVWLTVGVHHGFYLNLLQPTLPKLKMC